MGGWLDQPVTLHSSRAWDCSMDFDAKTCHYLRGYWHNWYQADRRYGLPTVAFFMTTIILFSVAHLISRFATPRKGNGPALWRRALALSRYFSYYGFRIHSLRWNSAPLGILLLGALGTTFFFCMDLIPQPYYWATEDYGGSPPLGTRSGWLALACMPFVFATASKANWITLLTGVPHERLQVFHRWIAYAFFVLALMHTFPFIVYHRRWGDLAEQVTMDSTLFYWTGIVALLFQAFLTFASFGPVRKLGYEVFKATHFIAVGLFVVVFLWHCDFRLSSWDYFIATAAIYVPCFVFPLLRTHIEYGTKQKAELFVEENEFLRVVIPATFHWVPGQHCFLRFRKFGLHAFTSHPFTICSLPSISPHEQSKLVFYIRHQSGFTARLYNYAFKNPGVKVPVSVDGPYGGIDPQAYSTSDRVLVIAGGAGAGWSLPFIERFARHTQGRVDSRVVTTEKEKGNEDEKSTSFDSIPHRPLGPSSMRVILATRDTATRVWYQKAINTLISTYPGLNVEIYLTGEAEDSSTVPAIIGNGHEVEAPPASATIRTTSLAKDLHQAYEDRDSGSSFCFGEKELHGRPAIPTIIHEEASNMAEAGKSLGIFVCGPESMQQDVRNAAAKENWEIAKDPCRKGAGSLHLHLEHFGWA